MDAFQTVEKYDQDILRVLNCENVLSLPGSRILMNMSTAGPITNRSLTGQETKDRYDGAFLMSPDLIIFLLTSNI